MYDTAAASAHTATYLRQFFFHNFFHTAPIISKSNADPGEMERPCHRARSDMHVTRTETLNTKVSKAQSEITQKRPQKKKRNSDITC
jgi:hypothetical protein